ncbi:hypothetical protein ABI214_17805 [Prescottella soli]|uniref:Uncharacterized protein n=1 Tax=Prescottella soli TaxID=1543852 RepID=A0ABW9FYI3_9NOCA
MKFESSRAMLTMGAGAGLISARLQRQQTTGPKSRKCPDWQGGRSIHPPIHSASHSVPGVPGALRQAQPVIVSSRPHAARMLTILPSSSNSMMSIGASWMGLVARLGGQTEVEGSGVDAMRSVRSLCRRSALR